MNLISKVSHFLSPLILFTIGLFHVTYQNHEFLRFSDFITPLLALTTIFIGLSLAILVYTRSGEAMQKVMTYIAATWLLFPFLVMPLLSFLFTGDSSVVKEMSHEGYIQRFYALLFFSICIAVTIRWYQKLPFPHSLQVFITVFAFAMLFINVVINLPTFLHLYAYGSQEKLQYNDVETLVAAYEPENKPHIIYIVPDRYTSNQVLADYYAFDNQPFSDQLRKRGFYVSDDQYANYTKTFQSLASTLNMNYLDDMVTMVGADETNFNYIYESVLDSQIQRILKGIGYYHVHMGNWWRPTQINHLADMNVSVIDYIDEFSKRYLSTTPFSFLTLFTTNQISNADQCDLIDLQKTTVLQQVQDETPQFIYWHLFVPHVPYIYNKDGSCRRVAEDPQDYDERKAMYLEHVEHTNNLVLGLYDQVVATSKRPVIFVVQSDEGPFPKEYAEGEDDYDFWEASNDDLRVKFGIFNAIFLPSKNYSQLKNDTSPINNFRHILNEIFAVNLPMHTHVFYSFGKINAPYKLKNISSRLQEK